MHINLFLGVHFMASRICVEDFNIKKFIKVSVCGNQSNIFVTYFLKIQLKLELGGTCAIVLQGALETKKVGSHCVK